MAETRAAARMARLVAQWRKSGESRASFARRHQMSPWSFWYWCRKLAADGAQPAAEAPRFVPVQMAGDTDASRQRSGARSNISTPRCRRRGQGGDRIAIG